MSNDFPMVIVGVRTCQSRTEHVVGDRVAGDHFVRALDRNVPTARADHDRELTLVVEQARDAGHVNIVVRTDHARDLFVEEHRELRCLHARLRDVIGVVEPDRQELSRPDRRQQAHHVQRILLAALYVIDDTTVFYDPVARTGARVESAEFHHDTSGIATGACSGA